MKSRLEKKTCLKLLSYKTHFLFRQFQFIISELLKSFLSFFPRNNRTQEILYSIFFCQSWWPTCCFCVSKSFDEWETSQGNHLFHFFSDGHLCSGSGFPSTSYNKTQNNTSTIQLLKQRLKDRKCSLGFKTFLKW